MLFVFPRWFSSLLRSGAMLRRPIARALHAGKADLIEAHTSWSIAMLRVVAFSFGVILALMNTPASAQNDWEVVSSKEGEFTIQMPAKPSINKSRVRKGGGGEVKTVLLGCTTEFGVYLALKVILPTAIVKGTEDAELDSERDSFAKEWNGKVIAEKKIRAGEKVGRDFTIRGKPDKGDGTLTIRVREYLDGNSIFIIAVISAPNRELPEDTGRFLGSLEIGKGRVRAQGTPKPEPKGKELAGWGLAIDPDNDCQITDMKGKLGILVPGTRHDLAAEVRVTNAPRVMREVEGDFVVTVKVVGEFRPGGKSTNPKGVPFNGAGILVWSDPDNFIRLERAAIARGKTLNSYVNFSEIEGGTPGAVHNEVMKGGDCWLRMERKGSRIHGSISFDGKTWKDLKPIQTVWPQKLKIGMSAVNSSSLPFAVTFEEYELKEKPKKRE
jgi:regulation of enolase protein 1 (concanavalin A-like superfamily)